MNFICDELFHSPLVNNTLHNTATFVLHVKVYI